MNDGELSAVVAPDTTAVGARPPPSARPVTSNRVRALVACCTTQRFPFANVMPNGELMSVPVPEIWSVATGVPASERLAAVNSVTPLTLPWRLVQRLPAESNEMAETPVA
jgi:hypothetical protein